MAPLDFIRRRPALIGYIVLGGGIIGGFLVNQDHNNETRQAVVDSGQAVAIESCNRDYNQTFELRRLIDKSYAQIEQALKDDRISPEAAAQQRANLAEALDRLVLPDCREVRGALTSDPDADIEVPVPLHPPDKPDPDAADTTASG